MMDEPWRQPGEFTRSQYQTRHSRASTTYTSITPPRRQLRHPRRGDRHWLATATWVDAEAQRLDQQYPTKPGTQATQVVGQVEKFTLPYLTLPLRRCIIHVMPPLHIRICNGGIK